MLVPAELLLAGLEAEFAHLSARVADRGGEGSSVQAIGHGLELLRSRETGGASAIRAQFASLAVAAREVEAILPSGLMSAELEELRSCGDGLAELVELPELERAWLETLAKAEAIMLEISALQLDPKVRLALIEVAARWETSDLADQVRGSAYGGAGAAEMEPESAVFQRYLRQRLGDEELSVTAFAPLPGGFGKQTVLFSVVGTALDGDFVMRRDQGGETSLENDCHYVRREYPVVKAVHERGFPSPEVLWLETDHSIVPGGDFIIMRRAPGSAGGSAFGPTQPVPEDLADSLAVITARLHGMEPLLQLGDVASFIRTDLWSLSREEAVRRYVRDWYDLYLRETHTPSPTLVTLYGWLFENVPIRPGTPSLIHGDIGFHNFLFDEGRLTAVLDWEFAHIGDPAEEIGYIATTVGPALDWPRFLERYVQAGGDPIDPATLHFFMVWSQVRNATAANLHATRFSNGTLHDLNLVFLTYRYVPLFLEAARRLIADGPDGAPPNAQVT